METLPQLIERSIAALTALDGPGLQRLLLELNALEPGMCSSQNWEEIQRGHRLLGAVLQKTEQNLRMLRGFVAPPNEELARRYAVSGWR